jgi:hypothetical protein
VADEQEKLRARQAKAYATAANVTVAGADPLAALQKSVAESKAQVEKKNIEIPTIALEQAVNTGDIDAIRAAATELGKAQGLSGSELRTFSYKTTQTAAKGEKPNPPAADEQFTYDYVWRQDVGGPGGKWVLTKTPNAGVADWRFDSNGMLFYKGKAYTGNYEGIDYVDGKGPGYKENSGGGGTIYKTIGGILYANGSKYTGIYQGKNYVDGIEQADEGGDGSGTSIFGSVAGTSTTRTLGRDQFKNSLALFFGATEAAKPWVDSLYDVVSKFYRTGSDVNESFNLALQDARNNPALKPFTDRFKGIYALQDLKLTGKPVLVPTIAEYVVSQAKMADILTEANLGSIATDEFTTELISKGNSVSTIADKIAKVYQRIDMAPKAIKDTLGRYFPTVDRTTLAKTLLTGQKGVNELVDELEQYEVLAAAEGQGLGAINRIGGVDLGRAQEYARSGQTFASLTPQFSKIARALPTTTKLSQISKVEDIGQVGLEKALISQSAKELEKLQELSEEEEARFSAKAGRAELGLASQRRANRAF